MHAFLPCFAAVVASDPELRAGIIRRHRISIGSLWRKLNLGQQALLVLVYLRKGETFASLAAGFGVGTATAWRYVEETVALLAARAPRLRKAARERGEGRARLPRPGRDADPHRPGRRGPALLLRQAQEARHEPAGHLTRSYVIFNDGAYLSWSQRCGSKIFLATGIERLPSQRSFRSSEALLQGVTATSA